MHLRNITSLPQRGRSTTPARALGGSPTNGPTSTQNNSLVTALTFASSSKASVLCCCSLRAATASADLDFLAALARLWDINFRFQIAAIDTSCLNLGFEHLLSKTRGDPWPVHLSVITASPPSTTLTSVPAPFSPPLRLKHWNLYLKAALTIGLEQAELITLSAFNNVCTLAFAVRSCSFKGRQNDYSLWIRLGCNTNIYMYEL